MFSKILPIFFVWRIALFVVVLVAGAYIPYRVGYDYTHLFGWANFDGVHYLNIARDGYADNGRFLPLYPILIAFFSFFSKNSSVLYWVSLLISNISFLISIFFIFKLVKEEKRAFKIFLYLLSFPTAFFFVSSYTESLFLALSLAGFYYSSRSKWKSATIIALVASVVRLTGIFLWMALLWDFFHDKKKKMTDWIFVFLPPISLIGYSIFNYTKWGDWLFFVNSHGKLGNSREVSSIILFPQTMWRYIKILVALPYSQYEWWIALLELAFFIFGLWCIYLLFKQKIKTSMIIFSLLCFFLPSMSGSFSGLPRYIAPIFPFFLVLSNLKSELFTKLFLIFGIVLQLILLILFSSGYFVS